MKFNIPKLLQFLDDPDNSVDIEPGEKNRNRGHATSIIGLIGEDLNAAVFRHYRDNQVEILQENVVQGFKAGKWLDRWIADHEQKVLYQCEIKNWAGASLGGRTLPVEAAAEAQREIAAYNLSRLTNYFTEDTGHPSNLTKVLLPMRRPSGYETYEVRPLLILWMLVTSNPEALTPLSHFDTARIPMETAFTELDIFSVSLYLRNILKSGIEIIELATPHIEERMKLMNSFMSTH